MRLCFDLRQGTFAMSAFELTFVRGRFKTAVMFPHLSVRKLIISLHFLAPPRGAPDGVTFLISLDVCRCDWNNVELEVDRTS
jgi:hypothetical protein